MKEVIHLLFREKFYFLKSVNKIMFKFKDTDLVYNCRLRDSLTAIYGVGFQKSSYICDSLGLGLTFNSNLMNSYFYEIIVVMLKSFYILDERLKSILYQRLVFFF